MIATGLTSLGVVVLFGYALMSYINIIPFSERFENGQIHFTSFFRQGYLGDDFRDDFE
jgi:hypothetical protein